MKFVNDLDQHIRHRLRTGLTLLLLAAILTAPARAAAPANDSYTNRITLSGTNRTISLSNAEATKELGEPNHGGNSGGRSVWYSWSSTSSGFVTLDTIGSAVDTLLGVYTNAPGFLPLVSRLVPVASDDDSGGNLASKLTFFAFAGVTYSIAVDGRDGNSGNIVLNLAQEVITGPQFALQPASLTVLERNRLVLSAIVTGQDLRYQWRKDGAEIGSATNASLSITNALPSDAGGYTLAVSNTLGLAVSSNAVVTVTYPYTFTTFAGTPGKSGFADGGLGTAQFSQVGGIALAPDGSLYVADSSNNILRKISKNGIVSTLTGGGARIAGSADGSADGARFNRPLGVALDSAGNLYVADSTNHTIRKLTPAGTVTTLAGSAGSLGSTDGQGSIARFKLPSSVATDGADNIYVSDTLNGLVRKITPSGLVSTLAGNILTSTNGGYNDDVGLAAQFGFPGGLAAAADGTVYLADTANQIIRRIRPNNLSVSTLAGLPLVAAGLNSAGGLPDGTGAGARFNNPGALAVGGDGTVFVADTSNHAIRRVSPNGLVTTLGGLPGQSGVTSNAIGNAARFNLPSGIVVDSSGVLFIADTANHAIVKGVPLAIFNAPQSQAVPVGSNVSLSVIAAGAPPLSYQWRQDGVALPGANDPSLTLSNAILANTGTYTLEVSNLSAALTATAVLTVLAPPTIVAQPTNQSLLLGSNLTFSVTASGTVPLNYQWRKDGANIVGATSNSYTLTATSASAGGAFSVTVSNQVGTAISSNFLVTVLVPPAIAGQPPAQSLLVVGTNFNLHVTAVGTAPLIYQWRKDGVNLPGATSADLPLNDAQLSQGGVYNVVITSDLGTVTSQNALVLVVPPITFTTLAGDPRVPGSTDGKLGVSARFNLPSGVAVDTNGNLFVADTLNHAIRKIATNGVVTTLAGTAGVAGSLDGSGSAARFSSPQGVAVDGLGNVYVADTRNHTIRKITSDGLVSTVAGAAGLIGAGDGAGNTARFSFPYGVALDATGNIFVADSGNNAIRKIASDGTVSTWAGRAALKGVRMDWAVRRDLRIQAAWQPIPTEFSYVVDTDNQLIRRISTNAQVTTFAGSPSVTGTNDGTAALFNFPHGIAIGLGGNIVVADSENFTIRQVSPAGTVTTVAGRGLISGSADGTAANARFLYPTSIAVDAAGRFYIADANAHTIRRITGPLTAVATLAGQSGVSGSVDGVLGARFSTPAGVAVDASGAVYVADTGNSVIRKITSDSLITFAGLAGTLGSANGASNVARFNQPLGVAFEPQGDLLVADTGNSAIRRITPAGNVSTFAGFAGRLGGDDGPGSSARFNFPYRLSVDLLGTTYVADTSNHVIRAISPSGAVTTLAGLTNSPGSADGTASAARFNQPQGVVADFSGSLYVADTGNNTIRKITTDGTVTTFAGVVGVAGLVDGPGIGTARFNRPHGMAIDPVGNLYVADFGNHAIRFITPNGLVATLGGRGVAGTTDGAGPVSQFNSPRDVEVDAAGNVYVADSGNHTIRKGFPLELFNGTASISAVAGQSTSLPLTFSGTVPFTVQWLRNGVSLPGQTNRTLALGTLQRADAGSYAALVTTASGTLASSATVIRVIVPESLRPPQPLPGGGFRLLFQGVDGGLPDDLSKLTLQSRSSVPQGTDTDWQTTTIGFFLTNGLVGIDDLLTNQPMRFYRVFER